ncbi:MAG: fibronectin type III domain-containing protein [Eggerthellaceae bacterium]
MKCPHCDAELQEGTPICPKCGERLTADEKKPESKGKTIEMPEKNPVRKSVAKAVIWILVIAAIVVAFVAYGLPAISEQLNPSTASSTVAESSSASSSADSQFADQITPTDDAAKNAEVYDSLASISAKKITLTLSAKERAIKVTFPKVKGAVNYRVAYWPAGSTEPSYVWTKGETSVVVKGLKSGEAYSFQVTAYGFKDGSWIRNEHSENVCGWLQKASAKLKAGKKSFTATVKKVKKADSYELIYASSKAGLAGGKTVTVKGKDLSATVKHLKSKETYYVKVRPIRTVDGVTCAGEYGAVSKVKVK